MIFILINLKNNDLISVVSNLYYFYMHKNASKKHFICFVPRFFARYQTFLLQSFLIDRTPTHKLHHYVRYWVDCGEWDLIHKLYHDPLMMAPQYLATAADLDESVLRKASIWDRAWYQKRGKLRRSHLASGFGLMLFHMVWVFVLHHLEISSLNTEDSVVLISMVLLWALSLSFLPDWIVDITLRTSDISRAQINVIWLLRHLDDIRQLKHLGAPVSKCLKFLHSGGNISAWISQSSLKLGCRPAKLTQYMQTRWFVVYKTLMRGLNFLLSLFVVICMLKQLFYLQHSVWTVMGVYHA